MIEAPFAFLEIEREVLAQDAFEAAQVTFRLVPEVLDAVDVAGFVGEALRMADAQMVVFGNVEQVIGCEAAGTYDGV